MLVRSLAASAAVHLGDAADRTTGATATPNVAAAAQMIDLLALLEEKTQGNLSEAEAQLLVGTLRVLRRSDSASRPAARPAPDACHVPRYGHVVRRADCRV